jgi:hypothetical protein
VGGVESAKDAYDVEASRLRRPVELVSEEEKMFAGILKALFRRETSALVEGLAEGRMSHAGLVHELMNACLRAGSEASRLFGPDEVARLLLAICPPRERTMIEDLAADISCVLQIRRDRLGQTLWDGEQLKRELCKLFETRTELCLRAAEFVRQSPALDADELSEPLCIVLERALLESRRAAAH